MDEAFKFWNGLQNSFEFLHVSVVDDLLEGQAANVKLQLPASWKVDLSEDPTPGSVGNCMHGPKREGAGDRCCTDNRARRTIERSFD